MGSEISFKKTNKVMKRQMKKNEIKGNKMRWFALEAFLSTKKKMQAKVSIFLGFSSLQTLIPTPGLYTYWSDVANTVGMAWQTP